MRLLLLALALAACASPTPHTAETAPGLAALGVTLSCNAEEDHVIDAQGRAFDEDGQLTLPVAITLPAFSDAGRFCMAAGCGPAVITRVPLSRTPNWAARITTDGGADRGVITVSDDRSSFELTDPDESGRVRVWTGSCAPSGS